MRKKSEQKILKTLRYTLIIINNNILVSLSHREAVVDMGIVEPLRRHNSIPAQLTLPSRPHLLHSHHTAPPPSFELISLSTSTTAAYTSLKDLLPSPAAINSPTTAGSTQEISIRNRLVKQAAWAYLQPMSASPDSSSHHFFRRFWIRLSLTSCLRHIFSTLSSALYRIRRALFAHV